MTVVRGKPDVLLDFVLKVAEHIYYNKKTILPFEGIGYKECVVEYK